jgi:hypothetical protein
MTATVIVWSTEDGIARVRRGINPDTLISDGWLWCRVWDYPVPVWGGRS